MALNLEHALVNEPQLARAPTREEIREYLDFHLSELIRLRDEDILPAIQHMAKLHPRIDDGDEETAGKFTENRNMARALIKTAKDRHAEQKSPWLEAGREVDDWKNDFIAVIEAALKPVDEIALDYGQRKAAIVKAKRDEEARKAREEADRKIAEAQRALQKAPDSAQATVALEAAAKASSKADRTAAKAQAPLSEMSRTRGMYGATMGVTTRWAPEIDMPTLVQAAAAAIAKGERPDWIRLLVIDDGVMRELAQERDARTRRPLAVIPGVTWVKRESVGTASVMAAE